MTTTGALLLHDDGPTLALARSLVESAGLEVRAVPSAYELMLLDGMPSPRLVVLGMTAIDERDMEIFPLLRTRWPDALMLVLYPSAMRERAARALALGADTYLPEPFYPGELLAIARRAVAMRPVAARPGPPAAPGRARPGGVEQLAAGVAHSIRNPLQILELQLGSADAEGGVDVPAMREQIRRIATVVDGLARFSGRRDLTLKPVDVNRLVDHVFADRRDAADGPPNAEGPSIAVETAAAGAVVLGSHELLRAALEAVRERAVRVTPAGGAIDVRTQMRTDEGRRVVEVTVTDGGPALSEDRRSRLFEPYPDAEAVQSGTGLELAAVAGIVRDHGGSVAALHAGLAGTTIVVRLPAGDGAPPAKAGPR